MSEIRVERLDSQVVALVFQPDGEWAYSRFPHPLITADYDADDRLIQVVAVGRKASGPIEALTDAIAAALGGGPEAPRVHADLKDTVCVA